MAHRDAIDRHRSFGATALVALVALSVAGCSSSDGEAGEQAAAAPPPTTSEPGSAQSDVDVVTVAGVGTADVAPDAARVTIAVEVSDSSVSSAFETAAERADAVIGALADAGVADDDMRTTSIDVRAQRDEPREPGAVVEISGYVVRNALAVSIADLEGAGAVLAAAVEAGGDATRIERFELILADLEGAGAVLAAAVEAGGDATRIDRFELIVTDDSTAMEAARAAAFEDARSSATAYAELAGRSLGELHVLTETAAPPGRVAVEEAADVAAPPVVAGTLTVTVSIRATWQLQ